MSHRVRRRGNQTTFRKNPDPVNGLEEPVEYPDRGYRKPNSSKKVWPWVVLGVVVAGIVMFDPDPTYWSGKAATVMKGLMW